MCTVDGFTLRQVAVVLAGEEGVTIATHDTLHVAVSNIVEPACRIVSVSLSRGLEGIGRTCPPPWRAIQRSQYLSLLHGMRQ